MRVLLFGIIREIAGKSEIELEYEEPLMVQDLVNKVKNKYEKLTELKSLLVAVNSEYAKDDVEIKDGDEVAMIPPVAGG